MTTNDTEVFLEGDVVFATRDNEFSTEAVLNFVRRTPDGTLYVEGVGPISPDWDGESVASREGWLIELSMRAEANTTTSKASWVDRTRDQIAWFIASAALNWIATPWYRNFIKGSIVYGQEAAVRDSDV